MSTMFDGFKDKKDAGTFEMGGADPLPDKTNVVAACEGAENKSFEGEHYINLKWRVMKPEQYNNRVLFQKVKCYSADKEKSDKGIRMLFAIATNAGGGLIHAMEKAGEETPSDQSLQTLLNRPMVLKVGLWKMDGKEGNWVMAVSPYDKKPAAIAPAPNVKDDGDDIPF